MNHVEFPGLGWSFNINPTAFSIGSFEIKWYGLLIATGFLLGIIYAMFMCKKMNINRSRLLDVAIVGLIAGVIGARLYYVIFYPGDKFIKDPISIFYIHDGGLGIYGGVIAAMLVGGLFAKFRKLKVTSVLDVAALGFLIGQAIGRWGNFINQEAFGGPTSMPWGMISQNTMKDVPLSPVHPCFFYESMWCILGFILLHIFTTKFRRYDGQSFLLYLIWYGTGRFFIEALRTDSLYVPYLPIKVSQLVAIISVLAGITLLIVFRNRKNLIGCGSKKMMAFNAERVAAMDGVFKFQSEPEKDKSTKDSKKKDAHSFKKEENQTKDKSKHTAQHTAESSQPAIPVDQLPIDEQEQEVQINNQAIRDIIDEKQTEIDGKKIETQDESKGANQDGNNH